MEKTYFFDAVVTDGEPDRVYSASDVAASRSAYLSTGVLSPGSLRVRAFSGRTVAVDPGSAVIAGYVYTNSAQKVISIGAAAALPRIDLVVLRLDLTARTMTVSVIAGSPAPEPAAPSPTDDGDKLDLVLAEVYVDAGATVLWSADVTDRRTFSTFLPTENAVDGKIAEAIDGLDILDEDELDAVRALAETVELDGEADKVLCADGEYRSFPRLVREELARFTTPGTYSFSSSTYPSASGFYDLELVGGGGAGGSSVGAYTRGGGGGAGAYAVFSGVRIANGSRFTVGAGGTGAPFADGTDGGDTTAAGFVAKGGKGGKASEGGKGGDSGCFVGASGAVGCDDVRMTAPPSAGHGGATVFGSGASNSGMDASARGTSAVSPGTGGAGGGGAEGFGAVTHGGNGAPGMIILYGYAEETEGVAD